MRAGSTTKEVSPMNEFLIALAAMANVVTALLSLWQEYKHQRMERIDKRD